MRTRRLSVSAIVALVCALLVSIVSAAGDHPVPAAIPFRAINPDYFAVKAALDARAPGRAVAQPATASGLAPTASPSWPGKGELDSGQGGFVFSPSDATGAIGATEYIEMVNQAIGVYDRTGTLLSQNDHAGFTGISGASGDGEIVWDPSQSRFFVSMLYNSGSDNELVFGFSKGPSPTASATDWCAYNSTFGTYGADLPDYPKLGMTSDFLLIGVNRFHNGSNAGSDVAWVTKPSTGVVTTCPALSSFTMGVKKKLVNADGSQAWTPVPGNQVDSSGTGFVVAEEYPGSGTSTVLGVFKVSKNATTGQASFAKAKMVTVPAYAVPPSAPQPGTANTFDTLDSRLTNAVLATDPTSRKTALWTQHTVAASAGGLGSEVRWYEINPALGTLLQNGIAHDPNQYTFMGAVSSDRNGSTHKLGADMVLGFNTSSSSSLPAAQMVSKKGTNPQSGFVLVAQSTLADSDFTCNPGPVCRWGDYSGASPDPSSTTGNVWLSVMLPSSVATTPGTWTTQNWEATP